MFKSREQVDIFTTKLLLHTWFYEDTLNVWDQFLNDMGSVRVSILLGVTLPIFLVKVKLVSSVSIPFYDTKLQLILH